jgi:hypothetical protein
VCVNRVGGDGTALTNGLSENWRLQRDRAQTYRTIPQGNLQNTASSRRFRLRPVIGTLAGSARVCITKVGLMDSDLYASARDLSGTE